MAKGMRRAIFIGLLLTTLCSFVAHANPPDGTVDNSDEMTSTLNQEDQKILDEEVKAIQKYQDSFLKDPLHVHFDPERGIDFSNSSGSYTANISGYLEFAGIDFGGNAYAVNPENEFTNALYIPSARIYDAGKIANVFRYLFSYDFAESAIKFAYLKYDGLNHLEIMGGQYKPAVSEGEVTDRPDMVFFERALPVYAFLPDYVDGTQILLYTHKITIQGGVLVPDPQGTLSGNKIVGGDPLGGNLLLTFSPIHARTRMFHMGVGALYQNTDRNHFVDFATVPEIYGRTKVQMVNTGNIADSSSYMVDSAELGGSYRSLSMTGEYYLSQVNRLNGFNTLFFNGYYVSASYILTGEMRRYDYKQGVFRGLSRIKHRYGAWELAARFSDVDLNAGDIAGGLERDLTVGLAWYPVMRVRMSLNYIRADATPAFTGNNRLLNIGAFQLRAFF